jgi:hypothetical protein
VSKIERQKRCFEPHKDGLSDNHRYQTANICPKIFSKTNNENRRKFVLYPLIQASG